MTQQAQSGLVPEFTMGDRLRKARELLGYEQGPFAALLGVSRGTISNYERDQASRVKPIVLDQWATKTGVSLEWLEHGTGTARPTPPDDGGQTDELARLTEAKRTRSRRPARHTGDTGG